MSDLDEFDAKTSGARRSLESGFKKQNRRSAGKAVGKKDGGSTWAGEYYRRSFPILPDVLDDVAKWANKLRISQNELVRWIFDHGIEALNSGTKPPIEDVVVRRRVSKE